jgi:hypothetical protein
LCDFAGTWQEEITLGVGRFVSDGVDDLNGPLSRAVSDVEIHYRNRAVTLAGAAGAELKDKLRTATAVPEPSALGPDCLPQYS